MKIFVVGLNHRTASADLRDKVAVPVDDFSSLASGLVKSAGQSALQELVIVSTCNRIEIYACTSELQRGISSVFEFLNARAGAELRNTEVCYSHSGRRAVEHLFGVAAGADSMIVGEPEILGQLKQAYRRAAEERACGPILGKMMQSAFRVGKRARAETEIGRGTASIARAGLRVCRELFGSVRNLRGLVVGAGYTAAQSVEVMHQAGAILTIANRTLTRAEQLAKQCHGRAVELDALVLEAAECDFMVTAITGTLATLQEGALRAALAGRTRPFLILDYGAPRNVDPLLARLPQIKLCSVTDLKSYVEADIERRRFALPHVQAILEEEAMRFQCWIQSFQSVPVVRAVRENADRVRRESLDALGQMSPHERDIVERFSQTFMNKLIHIPTLRLRECDPTTDTGRTRIDWACSLFGIDAGSRPQPAPSKEET